MQSILHDFTNSIDSDNENQYLMKDLSGFDTHTLEHASATSETSTNTNTQSHRNDCDIPVLYNLNLSLLSENAAAILDETCDREETTISSQASDAPLSSEHSSIAPPGNPNITNHTCVQNATKSPKDCDNTLDATTTKSVTHEEKSIPTSDEEGDDQDEDCSSEGQSSTQRLPPFIDYSNLEPIKSDFFIYAKGRSDLMNSAQSMVERHTKTEDTLRNRTLIMTALNEMLINEWEKESQQVRHMFFQKERLDWERFMKEENVIQRHCVTHTSRLLSTPQIRENQHQVQSDSINGHDSLKRRKVDESI